MSDQTFSPKLSFLSQEESFLVNYSNTFIQALEHNTLPWIKGFSDIDPFNYHTGQPYTASNYFRLMLSTS